MVTAKQRGEVKGKRAKESRIIDEQILDFIRKYAATASIVQPTGKGRGKADVVVNGALYGEGKSINRINQAEKLEQCAGRLRMFYKQPVYWLLWLSAGDRVSRQNWRKAVVNFESTAGEALATRYIFLDPAVCLEDTVTYTIENGALTQQELLSEYITTSTGQTL
jgi:hypothetical protein